MNSRKGFSLIEIIVAIAIMAIIAGAIAPVMFRQLEQTRYTRVLDDLTSIYEASLGSPKDDYFGFVGDVGRLPDSVEQLIDGTGQGTSWHGPYLALAGGVHATDVFGMPYVIDSIPVRVRSYGPDKNNQSGGGDDIYYPENPISTFKGFLELQVYINGRLITDATSDQVSASLSYAVNGTPSNMTLNFSGSTYKFSLPDSVHQGKHVLTVNAAKATLDAATQDKEIVTILPGVTTQFQVSMEDADYMTRLDTDLNGNGIPDRQEDMDGDGIPNSMDTDIDGDGTPNTIDPDSLDPTITGGGGATTPIVTAVTPNYGAQSASNLALVIDGSYFTSGATVTFSGTGVTVLTVPATFNASTQLAVSVNIGASAATGLRNVTVTNPSGQGGTGTNIFEVTTAGGSPSPSITQIVPSSGNQGATNLDISVQGQNFQSGFTTTFTNANITVVSNTFVNSSQLTVRINISSNASTGAGTMRITNPDAKFAETTFTVNALKPNIAQINPNNANSNTSNVSITVTGSEFLSGINASSSGSPLSIVSRTWVSSTQVTVVVNCGFAFTAQQRKLILTNPGGQADSANFTVNGLF